MSLNEHRRLRSETVGLSLTVGDGSHHLDVSLAYDTGAVLREVVFVGRGKPGLGLDNLLRELGIKLSRAIQRRNPDTGEFPAEPPRAA